jgi:hypothetical protein
MRRNIIAACPRSKLEFANVHHDPLAIDFVEKKGILEVDGKIERGDPQPSRMCPLNEIGSPYGQSR